VKYGTSRAYVTISVQSDLSARVAASSLSEMDYLPTEEEEEEEEEEEDFA